MKFLRSLYHFLGGVTFALILIASVALFVVVGTFIESWTQSHRYAAIFTYSNPLFGLLLWGFFVNILFSATRRWPFQVKHVPFLITHLGLLMIISGVMVKHYFGVQGTMSLIEGSGSQEILESGTYAIYVEKNGDSKPSNHELKKTLTGEFKPIITTVNGLWLRLMEYTPHSTERYQTWIKGDKATILGLNPLPVYEYDKNSLKLSGQVRFHPAPSSPWSIYAMRANKIEEVVQHIHQNHPTFSAPVLAIVEDQNKDVHLIAFNEQGHTSKQVFPSSTLESMVVYDNGFKGYTVRSELPFNSDPSIVLESMITPIHEPQPPTTKLETNRPKVTLHTRKNKQAQTISLVYDPTAMGIKWPILNGEYLLRFQPISKEIPYRIRLRNARQINYPNSQQPFSFESDLIITDRSKGQIVEKTISMNQVHETWDGYRFYLSSITPSDESAVKRIQIVVNYDPGKYWLTYPGACVLTCGIILLFWLRPYRKKLKYEG